MAFLPAILREIADDLGSQNLKSVRDANVFRLLAKLRVQIRNFSSLKEAIFDVNCKFYNSPWDISRQIRLPGCAMIRTRVLGLNKWMVY